MRTQPVSSVAVAPQPPVAVQPPRPPAPQMAPPRPPLPEKVTAPPRPPAPRTGSVSVVEQPIAPRLAQAEPPTRPRTTETPLVPAEQIRADPIRPPLGEAPVVSTAPIPEAPAAVAGAEDLEETMISMRRRPRRVSAAFTLQLSTGEEFTIGGSGLLGRNPRPAEGEIFDHVLVMIDPARSVSKTHIEFGVEEGKLWVKDRNSGNGTRVRHTNRPEEECVPGKKVFVEARTRVEIGNEFFIVLTAE
ncbi:FHA domain-containing protein [Klugiella xanthotipulae]|uniref:FHA domain-containing protein n=1 Tax=Klugiella xanthotipulae TaxID=244735 RepID=UPI001150087C|nr:FHA domain-containing protein [Klugiella xanthotipulae]